MADKIQIKRGNAVDLPILDDGELALAMDTLAVFVGNSGTNEQIYPPAPPSPPTVELSASSGSSTNTSTTYALVCTTSITTEGGPVLLNVQPDGTEVVNTLFGSNNGFAKYQILRDSTVIANWYNTGFASASLTFLDTGASAGAHTYQLQYNQGSSPSYTSYCFNVVLAAVEL